MIELNQQQKEARELIDALYATEDGGVGGYGHIVFDDGNIENGNIDYCLREAQAGKADLCEETRHASIKALEAFKMLTEDEREAII